MFLCALVNKLRPSQSKYYLNAFQMDNSKTVEISFNNYVDLGEVPLSALNDRSYALISTLLNKKKIFKSEEGYYRDWRGLFKVLKLEHYHKAELDRHSNPTQRVLDIWKESLYGGNLRDFRNALGMIDRWDVLDDSSMLFYEDANIFLSSRESVNAITVVETDENIGSDDEVITRDDTQHRKQFYDAFILFDDADIEFATKIMEHMEHRNLKLCVKDRDLLAGINFEHDAFIKLISERCRRLVVIISEQFLKSPLNNFFVMYAQALQIEQQKRKILPCVYERIELPTNLKFYFILDYKRSNKLYKFWDKLEDAIKSRKETSISQTKYPTNGEIDFPHMKIENADTSNDGTLGKISDPIQTDKDVGQERRKNDSTCKDLHKPLKSSLSTLEISEVFYRVLSNKSKYSSSSDLSMGVGSSDQEHKKTKWFSKLNLSSSKSSFNETDIRLDRNKAKWYKTSKKIGHKTTM